MLRLRQSLPAERMVRRLARLRTIRFVSRDNIERIRIQCVPPDKISFNVAILVVICTGKRNQLLRLRL
jgi:hypothetical protein